MKYGVGYKKDRHDRDERKVLTDQKLDAGKGGKLNTIIVIEYEIVSQGEWDKKENRLKVRNKITEMTRERKKLVSNIGGGTDKSTLLKLYRSLLRSKLEYGSIIYGSAQQQQHILKELGLDPSSASAYICIGCLPNLSNSKPLCRGGGSHH